jgi:hypothetical protein
MNILKAAGLILLGAVAVTLVSQPPSGSATGGKGGKRCLWQNRA